MGELEHFAKKKALPGMAVAFLASATTNLLAKDTVKAEFSLMSSSELIIVNSYPPLIQRLERLRLKNG